MKSYFESLLAGTSNSFLVREFNEKSFSAPYHYHPEYELTLILSGKGTRYTGNKMQNYAAGDLVLLGPNLPHYWKTEDDPDIRSRSLVVNFREDFMGTDFFLKPELKRVALLLKKSQSGVVFNNQQLKYNEDFSLLLKEKDPLTRLLLFLRLLQKLSTTARFNLADTQQEFARLSNHDKERINMVTAHIVANFHERISLANAAKQVNMTPASFCRYFKKITRKTFVEAINDYRVDYAIQKLTNTDKSISDIGFESGFNDLSNFNRIFRQRNALSPLQYRKKFSGK